MEKAELTSALNLTTKQSGTSPAGILEEYLASLSDEDREVIAQIQSSGGRKAMVLIHRGENKGARFLIEDQAVDIGRSTQSSIFLDDVTVSRKHALIERRVESAIDTFHLVDAGSLNGTYLNNESINDNELHSGDEIQIGKFHLLFVTGSKNMAREVKS